MVSNPDKRTRVKICGLTSLEDARFASGALADYIGFIFYEKSPRYVEPPKAGAIINWIEGPLTVGVFVNQALDDVNMVARQTGIDVVQLHGTESPDYCQMVELPVIKVFHVDTDTTANILAKTVQPYLGHIDHLLFDTKTSGLWGGTGKTFNWNVLKNLSHDYPFFLSGGLNNRNVKQACKEVSPFAVDVSSGIEQAPGIKDYDKMEAFFEKMREIWESEEVEDI